MTNGENDTFPISEGKDGKKKGRRGPFSCIQTQQGKRELGMREKPVLGQRNLVGSLKLVVSEKYTYSKI